MPVVVTECMSKWSVECECVCMRLDEQMVSRMTVVVLHWFRVTWVGKPSYSQVTSICIYTSIRLDCVHEQGREDPRERKQKYGNMNKQLYDPPTCILLLALMSRKSHQQSTKE